jgi:hypothetical protein
MGRRLRGSARAWLGRLYNLPIGATCELASGGLTGLESGMLPLVALRISRYHFCGQFER